MSEVRRICLTPTRNEAWVIDHFTRAAATWADHLLVADQGSTDGTREVLASAPKVKLINNDGDGLDERHRQRLLIDHARQINGKRILIALDADEALSADCMDSPEWERIANAAPGTVLRFRWVNIQPGFKQAWIPPGHVPFGFVDDGSEHQPKLIHSTRIPTPAGAPVLDLDDIVVLHFQYVAWERMESKRRWYQAWEHIVHRKKSPLQIFREYNHMRGGWGHDEIHPVNPGWLRGYEQKGIEYRNLRSEPVTWWDREIAGFLSSHGPREFRKIAIWDKDWHAFALSAGMQTVDFRDPRSFLDRAIHTALAKTQADRTTIHARALEWLLRKFGW